MVIKAPFKHPLFGLIYRVVDNEGDVYALETFKDDGSRRNVGWACSAHVS